MTEVPNARKVVSWGFEFGVERLNEVTLLGDYVVTLTVAERNEWARELLFGGGLPLLEALRVSDARLRTCTDPLSSAEVRVNIQCLAALHQYAQAWHLGVLARRAASRPETAETPT